MQPIRVLVLLVMAATAFASVAPTAAAAGGGPILPVAAPGEEGIESADGVFRYLTLSGSAGTSVLKIAEGTGELNGWTSPGRFPDQIFGVPQVAGDGSVSGLSADGGTLVLISAIGPIDQAKLLVLGTNKLRVLNRIELKGQFSFDAISPDGRNAYVVEYPKPFRYDQYRVLKLDLRTGHLAKEPIVDTDVGLEADEEGDGEEGLMRGTALSRVSSTDGRWAYTLYDGGGDIPFIHALDTVGDRAVCIFLPQLEGLDRKGVAKASIETGPETGTVSVIGREDLESSELARMDTATFAVTTPAAAVSESGAGMLAPLILAGLAFAALALGAIVLGRRRRA